MLVKQCFFSLILLLCYLHEGSSLTCYSCSASLGHDAACENITDHLSDISHHECFYANPVCVTYKIKYGSDDIIYRSCKNADVCYNLSKKFNTQYNKLLDCRTCSDNDLCNSSIPLFSLVVFTKLCLFSIIINCLFI